MAEIQHRTVRSRVKGRPQLVKRIGALFIATHRYAQARATTADERAWASRVLDALRGALDAAGVVGTAGGNRDA
jgi:hypothetical protein